MNGMSRRSRVDAATGGLTRSLSVGLVCGMISIVQSIGFATLLVSGAPRIPASAAVGMALLASGIHALLTPLASSGRGIIATSQDIPVAAMAGIVAAIVAGVPEDDTAALATVVAAVALTSVLVGISGYLLGRFSLSRFIRLIPFPVVAGFLAGSGWLIALGGINTVAGFHVAGRPIAGLMDTGIVLRFASTAVFLAAVALGLRLTGSRLSLPLAVAAGLVLFNIAVLVSGLSGDALREAHWLMVLPGGSGLWPPVTPAGLAAVDWYAIGAQAFNLPTVVILSLVAMLMNATGIELDTRRDLDLDRELRAMGGANVVAGMLGGIPGYHNLSQTILSSRLGAATPAVGLTVAFCCFTAVAFGPKILSVVPMPLLGGVLVWIGAGLIRQWLFGSYARLGIAEYAVVILIFAVVVFVGFAWGILVGLLAAALLFAVEYGRIDIVRYTLTGRDYQTRAGASEERLDLLRNNGEAILLLRLQGFLFFGTADGLRRRIQQRLTGSAGTPIRFLVVDFQRVSGLDSSAVLSFVRLAQMARPDGFVLMLTGMSAAIENAMVRGGLEHGASHAVHIGPSFDYGVEWCEDALLAEIAPALSTVHTRPARETVLELVRDEGLSDALLPYFERADVARGGYLITQGEPSDDIFFIESGRAAVELATDSGHRIRLATIGHGSVVGEVAFYLAAPRSASVIAEGDIVAWRFSRASLTRLQQERPEIAARFHEGITTMLAARLTGANRLIQLLAD
jgi:SulP family sulfate permease